MDDQKKSDTVIRDLDSNKNKLSAQPFFIVLVLVIFVGVIIGFFASTFLAKSQITSQNITTQKTAGIADKKTFKDKAEGTLKEGGVDGEGNFHLVRPGGESQNVYLTSSTVDLSQYVGKKVRVWGETFQAEKAGWLMDVGLVEVLQ
ncbi:hypothetical protein A3C28_04130 [Candidatus Roizmanbacteria bacterium RIFCSPHIGHO2_02_FULL_39_9]|uniref:Uncharacterized protein n=2 Tax=Candidatus Roizmaniibacteriota TaxID=1752723 RepID=A0A1F7HZN2_9BACT|nr:MAG: hypothetical protein A3C28_04130 [Candidatus Roizmanbacteria bacterium RIFCSPHIGHO2_02_FULL_39_9]OGK36587.1 MAG: hypothetical protein A3F60_01015 [Candidatus Roizmanbacteria bacterium RIFCSPHIGHO2_12_FULL_39_8]